MFLWEMPGRASPAEDRLKTEAALSKAIRNSF
jgi:hypothetical protein